MAEWWRQVGDGARGKKFCRAFTQSPCQWSPIDFACFSLSLCAFPRRKLINGTQAVGQRKRIATEWNEYYISEERELPCSCGIIVVQKCAFPMAGFSCCARFFTSKVHISTHLKKNMMSAVFTRAWFQASYLLCGCQKQEDEGGMLVAGIMDASLKLVSRKV